MPTKWKQWMETLYLYSKPRLPLPWHTIFFN